MAAIRFDTHKFIRKLRDAGFEENQAEAVSDAFKEATGEAELATKRDLESVEIRLNARLEAMEYRLTIKLGTFIMMATGIVIAVMKL
ncbi:MAG: DUF1640 domain-containing protein [Methylobacter sp.]